jgi:hypothetical protein
MTWSVVQSYGTAQNKTSGTSIKVFSPGTYAIAVGDVLIAQIVCDNAQTTTGASSLVSSVAGTQSGTFTKAGEHTHSPTGAAADGVTVSVWYKRVTAAGTAGGDEVTFTLGTAVTAKCAGVHIFRTDQAEVNVKAFVADVATVDFDAMTLSGLPNREYLFLRNDALERGSYGYSKDLNYTSYGVNTTRDAGDTTDVATGNQYRILTATGDTCHTATTGTFDSASLFLAFIDASLIDPVSALTDNFDDNARDTAKWKLTVATGAKVEEIRGRLEITPPVNATGTSGYVSVNTYDLTGSSAHVRLVQKLNAENGLEVYYLLFNGSNWLGFIVNNGGFSARYRVGGVTNLVTNVAYSASTHAWLRIRESGGTTYWETAPNTASNPPVAADWVAFASVANPIDITSVNVQLRNDALLAVADPGTAIFDGFNTTARWDENVKVTGVAATGETGTVSVSASATAPVTGVAATGETGTVSVSASATAPVTGVAATGEIGTVEVSGSATVPVTGVETLSAVGAAAVAERVTNEFWGMHLSAPQHEPWPLVEFKTLRLWDVWPSIDWADINTSSGVYDWTEIDAHLAVVTPHAVDIIYTFGYVPLWVTGSATDMPTEQAWTDFVTAITNRYGATIKYWEIWNEPNETAFWTGTHAQMARLTELAAPIIRAAGGTVLSPSPQGSSAYTWFDTYFATVGSKDFDVLAFHSYTFEAPETLIDDMANLRGVMSTHGVSTPIWDTEGSWGDDTWPFGISDDLKKAYLARLKLLSHSLDIKRACWYAYENFDWGKLADRNTDTLYPAGEAYNVFYGWIEGKRLTPYSATGSVYEVNIYDYNAYGAVVLVGKLVWNTAGDSAYSAPFGTYQRRTLEGVTTVTSAGQSVTVGIKPLLFDITGNVTVNVTGVESVTAAGSVTAVGVTNAAAQSVLAAAALGSVTVSHGVSVEAAGVESVGALGAAVADVFEITLRSKVGSFTLRDTAGLQSITVGFTPKVVKLWVEESVAVDSKNQLRRSFGAFDGTSQWASMGAFNVSTGYTTNQFLTTRCLLAVRTDPKATLLEAEFSSIDPNGFTINVLTGAAKTIYYEAEGGSHLTVKVGTFDAPAQTTGSQAVIGVGFTPKALFFHAGPKRTDGASQGDVEQGFGLYAHGVQAGMNYYFAWNTKSKSASLLLTDACLVGVRFDSPPQYAYKGAISSVDLDGFTINWTASPYYATKFGYIAYAGAAQYQCGTFNASDTLGLKDLTGVKFTPASEFYMSHRLPASSTGKYNALQMVAIASASTNAVSTFYAAHDSASSSQPLSYSSTLFSTAFSSTTGNGTAAVSATIAARSSGTITFDWKQADASKSLIAYLIVGNTEVRLIGLAATGQLGSVTTKAGASATPASAVSTVEVGAVTVSAPRTVAAAAVSSTVRLGAVSASISVTSAAELVAAQTQLGEVVGGHMTIIATAGFEAEVGLGVSTVNVGVGVQLRALPASATGLGSIDVIGVRTSIYVDGVELVGRLAVLPPPTHNCVFGVSGVAAAFRTPPALIAYIAQFGIMPTLPDRWSSSVGGSTSEWEAVESPRRGEWKNILPS